MPNITMTSVEFEMHPGRAKQATSEGLVLITEQGQPCHVLMSIEHYRKLSTSGGNIVDMLAQSGAGDIEFEACRLNALSKPVDFS